MIDQLPRIRTGARWRSVASRWRARSRRHYCRLPTNEQWDEGRDGHAIHIRPAQPSLVTTRFDTLRTRCMYEDRAIRALLAL